MTDNPTQAQAQLSCFVSYALLNHKFAGQLVDYLNMSGQIHVWQDKKDLPQGKPYDKELERAIRESDVFMFVYSDDALASPTCNKELQYARSLNKRIIPFRYRPVYTETELDTVRKRRKSDWDKMGLAQSVLDDNYTFLSENHGTPYWDDLALLRRDARFDRNDTDAMPRFLSALRDVVLQVEWGNLPTENTLAVYDISLDTVQALVERKREEMFAKLLQGLVEDIDHVRQHTRFGELALDWQNSQKKNTNLLNLNDTNEAEQWLTESANKKPQSTPLMLEFIKASRQRHTRNLQRTIAGIVIALVVAIVLAVIAVNQMQRANLNEDIAKQEAAIAIEERNNAQNTLQTFALDNATLKIPVAGRVSTPIRLDGSLWVVDKDNATLLDLSAVDGTPLHAPIPLGLAPIDPVTDGQYIWVANGGEDTLMRIDPQTHDTLTLTIGGYPREVFVYDGGVWVVTEDGMTQVVGEDVVQTVDVGARSVRIGAFDGVYLWLLDERNQRLHAIDVQSGQHQPFDLLARPQSIGYDGNVLWLTYRDSGQLDIVQGDTRQTILTEPTPIEVLTVTDDSVWIASETGDVVQLDTVTRQSVQRQRLEGRVAQVVVDADVVWVFMADGRLVSWHKDTPENQREDMLNVSRVLPVFDSVHMWLADAQTNVIMMVDVADGQLIRTLMPACDVPQTPYFDGANVWFPCHGSLTINRVPALLSFYAFDRDSADSSPTAPIIAGGYLWIVQEASGMIEQIDIETGQLIDSFDIGATLTETVSERTSYELVFESVYDGRYLWTVSGQSVTRVDPQDLALSETVPLSGMVSGAAFIHDKLWVTNMNFSGRPSVLLIDTATMEQTELSYGNGAFEPVYDEKYDVIWLSVSHFTEGYLYRIDAQTLETLNRTPLGVMNTAPVLLDNDTVWTVSILGDDAAEMLDSMTSMQLEGTLYRLDRVTGELIDRVPVNELPNTPTVGDAYVWVPQVELGMLESGVAPGLLAFDPDTASVVWSWEDCSAVNLPYYDGRYIWASCFLEDAPSDTFIVDDATLDVVRVYPDLGDGSWPAVRINDDIWIVHQSSAKVSVFDLDANLLREYGIGNSPSKPVFDGRYIWIANADDGTVQRILHNPESLSQ